MGEWQTLLLGPLAALAGAIYIIHMFWRKLEQKDAYITEQTEVHFASHRDMIRESNTALNANTAAMVALTSAIRHSGRSDA